MSILIRNGRIVTAVDDYYADVLIEGETVTQIGQNLHNRPGVAPPDYRAEYIRWRMSAD